MINWCPGHEGVTENEQCDALAKEALTLEQLPFTLFSTAQEQTVATMLSNWQQLDKNKKGYMHSINFIYPDPDIG